MTFFSRPHRLEIKTPSGSATTRRRSAPLLCQSAAHPLTARRQLPVRLSRLSNVPRPLRTSPSGPAQHGALNTTVGVVHAVDVLAPAAGRDGRDIHTTDAAGRVRRRAPPPQRPGAHRLRPADAVVGQLLPRADGRHDARGPAPLPRVAVPGQRGARLRALREAPRLPAALQPHRALPRRQGGRPQRPPRRLHHRLPPLPRPRPRRRLRRPPLRRLRPGLRHPAVRQRAARPPPPRGQPRPRDGARLGPPALERRLRRRQEPAPRRLHRGALVHTHSSPFLPRRGDACETATGG